MLKQHSTREDLQLLTQIVIALIHTELAWPVCDACLIQMLQLLASCIQALYAELWLGRMYTGARVLLTPLYQVTAGQHRLVTRDADRTQPCTKQSFAATGGRGTAPMAPDAHLHMVQESYAR